MPPEIRTETVYGKRIRLGRNTLVEQREATIVTDMRATPWGVYDFGHTTYGPARWVRDSTPD